jgi:hypothetical protein
MTKGRTNVRNVLALAALGAALLSGPAFAGPNSYEYVSAYGDSVYVSASDQPDGNSYVSIEQWDSYYFYCYANLDGFDLVSTTGNAGSGTIDLTEVLAELQCSGTPPTSVSVECSSDGDYSQHHVGNTTYITEGQRTHQIGHSWYNSAACTAEISGTTYEMTGYVVQGVSKTK